MRAMAPSMARISRVRERMRWRRAAGPASALRLDAGDRDGARARHGGQG